MTNYEHLVETGKLAELLTYACNADRRIFFDMHPDITYDMNKTIGEILTEYLQAEYIAPVYYVKVDDLINLLYKPERVIQDHVTGSKSTTIRTIDKDMLLSELRLYTKDTINE